ncbi:GTP-binding protein [Candidatus Shapirobacteria bacterium]|nr:GTP-binding protein [Candidatus Shapirobacteria bacterium]
MADKNYASKFSPRPPVVTFLGHIDHGKTSLLDKIRQTNISQKEVGGITQKIGAYQIEYQGEKITFVDTPGHEVFAKMRSRGAQVTDLAVLVIAANEGVMPQTEESLQHIKEAGVPFLVALNKMDLPGADPEKVKNQLTALGVLVEDRGGEVVTVPVSAKTGEGIKDLLEMILLLAKMNDLKAPVNVPFSGVVIESGINPRRGTEVSLLVQEGELRKDEEVWAANQRARVKAIFDDRGRPILKAQVSQPVLVLGFSSVVPVGEKVLSAERVAKLEEKLSFQKDKFAVKETGGKPAVIFKADTLGVLEAILSLPIVSKLAILSSGVGEINESDILLASSFGGKIFGFNVSCGKGIEDLAETEGVKIERFNLIYELNEALEEEVKNFSSQIEEANILGEAVILAKFNVGGEIVAGGKVLRGEIVKGGEIELWRGKEKIGEAKITSFREGKKDIEKAKIKEEFGAVFSPHLDFAVNDVIRYKKNI